MFFRFCKNNDSGYIVVETIGAFIPFVLLVVSIVSLINIVTVQSRVQYALTQAANTLAMYSYALEVTKIAPKLMGIDAAAEEAWEEIDGIKDGINGVIDGLASLAIGDALEHGMATFDRVIDIGEAVIDDPKQVLDILLNFGGSVVLSELFEKLVRPLVGRYLSNGNASGHEYLLASHVVGGLEGLNFNAALDFNIANIFNLETAGHRNSVFIDRNGDIKLIIQYEIEYRFGALPLPFGPTLKITQQAKTKAWLGGSGEGYWKSKK